FFGAEQLLRLKFIFAAAGATQKPQVQRHYILLAGIHAIQSRGEAVKTVVISHHHQHVAGTHSQCLRSEIVAGFDVELIKFGMSAGAFARDHLRNFEYGEKNNRESDSGDSSNFLGKQIDHAERDQRDSNDREAERNFGFADVKIQRYAILSLPGFLVAEH